MIFRRSERFKGKCSTLAPIFPVEFVTAPPLVSQFCKMDKLDIIDCSNTPTGTHKDFRSAQLLEIYGEMNPAFYLITMGNAGYSLGKLAVRYNKGEKGDVQVVNIVDVRLDPTIKAALEEVSTVIELDLKQRILTIKELREIVKKQMNQKRIVIHAERRAGMYQPFVTQISMRYSNHDYLVLPIGSGELLSEVLRYIRQTPCCFPHGPKKIIPVTVEQNIFSEKYQVRNKDSSVADKLVSPTSLFFQTIRERFTGNYAVTVSDGEILEAYRIAIQAGIKIEPSAAAVFAGLRKIRLDEGIPGNAKVAVISTGCGLGYNTALEPG